MKVYTDDGYGDTKEIQFFNELENNKEKLTKEEKEIAYKNGMSFGEEQQLYWGKEDYCIEEDLEETKKCLKEANKEIERLNNIINETKEEINQYKTLIETGVKGNCKKIYKQEALNILEMILLKLKGDGSNER